MFTNRLGGNDFTHMVHAIPVNVSAGSNNLLTKLDGIGLVALKNRLC
jgi:hypothetical protein